MIYIFYINNRFFIKTEKAYYLTNSCKITFQVRIFYCQKFSLNFSYKCNRTLNITLILTCFFSLFFIDITTYQIPQSQLISSLSKTKKNKLFLMQLIMITMKFKNLSYPQNLPNLLKNLFFLNQLPIQTPTHYLTYQSIYHLTYRPTYQPTYYPIIYKYFQLIQLVFNLLYGTRPNREKCLIRWKSCIV